MYNSIRKRLMVLISFIFLMVFVQVSAKDVENEALLNETKNVLYISSYSYSLSVVPQQLDGIKERFEGQPIILDVMFMDSKRYNVEENYANIYNSLKYKLDNGLRYDAVIVGDDNGLDFLMTNKETLFKDTPIFFLGINSRERGIESSKHPDVIGVLESKSIKKTFEFASMINPTANRLIMVKDNSRSSLGDYHIAMTYEKDFPNLEFVTVDLSTMTFDEYAALLPTFKPTDIFINFSAITDKNGNVMTFDEMRIMQVELLETPIYGLTTVGIGEGVFGGVVVSHEEQGHAAADMVMTYFYGTPVSDIPFDDESPNSYLLDYEIFETYGYDEENLPDNVIFVNRELTFWQMYSLYIVIAIAVIIVETIIIIMLIKNSREKNRSHIKLKEQRESIQEMNEELKVANEDLSRTNLELEDSIIEVNERDNKIKKMIYVDELTGVMTSYALKEYIEEAIDIEGISGYMFLMDVDDFKTINDAFGHNTGDEILIEISSRMSILQGIDAVSRFGGDEFILIVKDVEDNDNINEIVRKVQEALKEPIELVGSRFFINVSIGIALFPDHGITYGELIKHADVALNKAKKGGKNKAVLYSYDMDKDIKDKIKLRSLIRSAFEHKDFYLNFQPIIEVESMKIKGFEALVRWYSDELGQVSPYHFIKEVEEMGMITTVGKWIFREACLFAKKMNEKSDSPKYISINISGIQLMDGGFLEFITRTVEEIKIAPELIYLEMTESILLDNVFGGNDLMDRIHEYGFNVSIDDFGTGYSSLSYLKQMDVDCLKIDKSFVDEIETNEYDSSLVEAMIKIANIKGICIIAEGVELISQYDLLVGIRCSAIQGYLFSKPLSEEKALEIVNKDFHEEM